MLLSPFTFLRGSAALMAYDLSTTPTTGIQVQACGDCHLLNFGLFATPERNLVFDFNDFDETLPPPGNGISSAWWSALRLPARENQLSDGQAQQRSMACARAYREHLRAYSRMSPLEVWYQRMDVETIIDMAPDARGEKGSGTASRKSPQACDRTPLSQDCQARWADDTAWSINRRFFTMSLRPTGRSGFGQRYRNIAQSLSDERRMLLDRYHLEDSALKVVGIGSVGTRCYIGLLVSDGNHPLMLQFKEACRSVLEPYTEQSLMTIRGSASSWGSG